MKLEAVNNYVTLKMREPKEIKIGLFDTPDSSQKIPRWGDVLSVGPGVVDFNGQLIKPDVEVGELVYVTSHGQHEVKTFGVGLEENLHVASVLDVLVTVKDIDKLEIQPLGSYIEIEKIDVEEEKIGNFYIPDMKRFPPNSGIVKTLGKGWINCDGSYIPFQVEVGDLVIYNPFSEMVIDFTSLGVQEKKYLIMHGEIQAIIRKNVSGDSE